MAALHSRCGHYIFILWFLLSFFFHLFSSPKLSGRKVDVYHTSIHDVALVFRMVWNLLHAARWKYRTQKWRKKIAIYAPSHNFVRLYLHNEGIVNNRKNLLNSNMSPTCLHNMANVGPTNGRDRFGSLGTRANVNGVCVLALLLQQRCSMEIDQTLHDIWPSASLGRAPPIFRGRPSRWV